MINCKYSSVKFGNFGIASMRSHHHDHDNEHIHPSDVSLSLFVLPPSHSTLPLISSSHRLLSVTTDEFIF